MTTSRYNYSPDLAHIHRPSLSVTIDDRGSPSTPSHDVVVRGMDARHKFFSQSGPALNAAKRIRTRHATLPHHSSHLEPDSSLVCGCSRRADHVYAAPPWSERDGKYPRFVFVSLFACIWCRARLVGWTLTHDFALCCPARANRHRVRLPRNVTVLDPARPACSQSSHAVPYTFQAPRTTSRGSSNSCLPRPLGMHCPFITWRKVAVASRRGASSGMSGWGSTIGRARSV